MTPSLRSFVLLLLGGCSTAPVASSRIAPTVPTTSTGRCDVSGGFGDTAEWETTYRFDERGRLVVLEQVSHAAGTTSLLRHLRDADGRVVRLQTEMLEGVGGDGPPEAALRYREEPSSRRISVDVQDPLDPRTEVWTYDAAGRPASLEVRRPDAPRPQTTTCGYDARGRPVARNDDRWIYGSSDDPIPTAALVRAYGDDPVPLQRVEDGVRLVAPEEDDPAYAEFTEWRGRCLDVLFAPCSALLAPPPPTGTRSDARAPEPAAAPREGAGVPEEVVRSLGICAGDDEPCRVEVVAYLGADAGADPDAVAVLEMHRGPEEAQSHHLLVSHERAWRRGPQIADGPWNGNQVYGTFEFAVDDAQLRQLAPGGPLELLLRYRSTTAEEDEERGDVEVRERGWLTCVDLLREPTCVRFPEWVERRFDALDETREATATVTFERAGVRVRRRSGSDPRIVPGLRTWPAVR